MNLPNGNRVHHTYRWDNLRSLRQIYAGATLGETQATIYDGDEPLYWRITPSGHQQVFVQAHCGGGSVPDTGGSLVRMVGSRAGGQVVNRTFHTDALGNTLDLTGWTTQTQVSYSYDAWGNVAQLWEIGSTQSQFQPMAYGGGYGYWYDTDLNLNYARSRWLDPSTGSWLSVDPVTSEPRYTYVRNMPTMLTDPMGTGPFGLHWDLEGALVDAFVGTFGVFGIHLERHDAHLALNALRQWGVDIKKFLCDLGSSIGGWIDQTTRTVTACSKSAWQHMQKWMQNLKPKREEVLPFIGGFLVGIFEALLAIGIGLLISLIPGAGPILLIGSVISLLLQIFTGGFRTDTIIGLLAGDALKAIADAQNDKLSGYRKGEIVSRIVLGIVVAIFGLLRGRGSLRMLQQFKENPQRFVKQYAENLIEHEMEKGRRIKSGWKSMGAVLDRHLPPSPGRRPAFAVAGVGELPQPKPTTRPNVLETARERARGLVKKVKGTLKEGEPLKTLKSSKLIGELAKQGIKHSPKDIVSIMKTNGRIIFLEIGNVNSGMAHIVKEHGLQFLQRGLKEEDIPAFLMKTISKGKGFGRPIYEITIKGVRHVVSITVGSNGYIVGANFLSSKSH